MWAGKEFQSAMASKRGEFWNLLVLEKRGWIFNGWVGFSGWIFSGWWWKCTNGRTYARTTFLYWRCCLEVLQNDSDMAAALTWRWFSTPSALAYSAGGSNSAEDANVDLAAVRTPLSWRGGDQSLLPGVDGFAQTSSSLRRGFALSPTLCSLEKGNLVPTPRCQRQSGRQQRRVGGRIFFFEPTRKSGRNEGRNGQCICEEVGGVSLGCIWGARQEFVISAAFETFSCCCLFFFFST